MIPVFLFIFIAIVAVVLGLGFSLFLKPGLVIELQKKFYALINWRIEPISLSKEIRNTKAMGLFLMFMVIVSVFLAFSQDWIIGKVAIICKR
jgi:hypothetical protein